MKKLYLIFKNYPSVKDPDRNDCGVQYLCKIFIIDAEIDEDDQEFKVVTFRTDPRDKQYTELMNDLSAKENHIYLMMADDECKLEGRGIFNEDVNKIIVNHQPVKFSLTRKQKIIMDLFSEGLVYKEVGARLNRSYHTIKNHVSNVLGRMEVKNIDEAIDAYKIYKNRVN